MLPPHLLRERIRTALAGERGSSARRRLTPGRGGGEDGRKRLRRLHLRCRLQESLDHLFGNHRPSGEVDVLDFGEQLLSARHQPRRSALGLTSSNARARSSIRQRPTFHVNAAPTRRRSGFCAPRSLPVKTDGSRPEARYRAAMPHVLSLASWKGGAGKTTTASISPKRSARTGDAASPGRCRPSGSAIDWAEGPCVGAPSAQPGGPLAGRSQAGHACPVSRSPSW